MCTGGKYTEDATMTTTEDGRESAPVGEATTAGTITRYCIDRDGEHDAYPNGEWVKFEDHEKLLGAAIDLLSQVATEDPVIDDPVWLRNEVRRQRGVIGFLYNHLDSRAREVLAQVDLLSDSQLVVHENAGPFRHICRAAIAQRKARGSWSP
jgi:hypothetical protein